jgi:hypothetical protein
VGSGADLLPQSVQVKEGADDSDVGAQAVARVGQALGALGGAHCVLGPGRLQIETQKSISRRAPEGWLLASRAGASPDGALLRLRVGGRT